MSDMFRSVAALMLVLISSALSPELHAAAYEEEQAYFAPPFANAPPELHAFFLAAKVADAIADPLQRCLTFPDVPGNHWPKGLAAWYCEKTYGPRITLVRVTDLINRSAWAELNALFRADLKRHFDADHPSEAIHADLDIFWGSDADQERLSKKWLDNDPTSPFANAARATYLSAAGIKARGGAYRSETPDENFRKMEVLTSQAIKVFEKSLVLEPKLSPAHADLVMLGGYGATKETVRRAYEHGMRIAPHCTELTENYMHQLEPKWGGSMEQMDAYARQLAPLARRYPQQKLTMILPDYERAKVLDRDEKEAESAALLETLVLEAPSVLVMQSLAMTEESDRGTNGATEWKNLMHLLAAYRYSDREGCCSGYKPGAIARRRGSSMVDLNLPEWGCNR
jgi:hypothetical protein